MTKKLYKLNRHIQRKYSKHPLLFMNDMIKISSENAKLQTFMIAGQIYNNKDKPCHVYDERTKKWKPSIHKKNEESKEDFEKSKAIKIANIWINYVKSIVDIYSLAFPGKVSNYNIKNEMIKIFINQLKEVKKNDK